MACVPCGRNPDKWAANGAMKPQAGAKRRGDTTDRRRLGPPCTAQSSRVGTHGTQALFIGLDQ